MKKSIKTTTRFILILLTCLLSLIPYVLVFISSLNTSVNIRKGDIFSNLSLNNLANNFSGLFSSQLFLNAMVNSLLVSIIAVVIGVLSASLAGYAYVIFKSKKSEIAFYISFFNIMIPSTVTIIPLFMMLQKLNILDSLFTISLLSLSLPFLIYLFKQNTKMLPIELIKAARIDGLTEFQIFFKIYLPFMKSVVITAGMMLFIESWNSFLIPLVVVLSQSKMTLLLYLNNLGSSIRSDYGVFMLALFLSTLPIMIIFIIFQKHFKLDAKLNN